MSKSIRVLFFVLLLAGCGDNKSEDFSYNYTVNGCSTGEQSFGSKEALCNGLADDERNNGCAGARRCEEFNNQGCESITGISCF